MTIECNNAWPSALPLPVIAYSGSAAYSTITTQVNDLAIARRSRFQKNYPALTVQWTFTDHQRRAFQSFFKDTLGNGVSQFSILLRFPRNSTLVDWVVKFVSDYKETYIDCAQWQLSADLLPIQQIDIFNNRIVEDDDIRITMDDEMRTI